MNMHAPWSEARESALANAKRAIAFASDKLEALQAETTKLAAIARDGYLPPNEIADEMADCMVANGIFDADAVQGIIADALDDATLSAANGADHEPPPPNGEEDYGLGAEPPSEAEHHEPLQFIDTSRWDSERAPPRAWAVKDRIPLRQPTLFSGEGAAGKTLAALQLSIAHAAARDWLGMLPEPGPALYFGCEDEADELHRRCSDIVAHYGLRFADLRDLHLLSFAGKDAALGIAARDGTVKPTALFDRLRRAACDIQPKLITLDTLSDVFIGDENNRAQSRQFVALLRALAIEANAGIIVCSHPSLTGISTGTGLSGSTSWHNSVRSRMYLRTAATEAGEEPDPELRQLEFMKNNYGPLGERVLLRWRAGVFVPEPGTGSLERAAAEAKIDSLFLALLERFAKQERNLSDKTGPTYAPAIFAQEPEAKSSRVRKQALADAMRRLFAADRIHLESYGKPSRRFQRLAPGAKR